MKTAERIVLVALLLVMIGGVSWIYFAIQAQHQETVEAVSRGEFQIPSEVDETPSTTTPWQQIYPDTVPITIGSTSVRASIADTMAERIEGLSGTPYIPDQVVKLFAFGAAGNHSIWMKDMNYALDILWVNREGEVVHIEESVAPDTYPESFSSPVPAWYVVEAGAGFVERNDITTGDLVVVPVAN